MAFSVQGEGRADAWRGPVPNGIATGMRYTAKSRTNKALEEHSLSLLESFPCSMYGQGAISMPRYILVILPPLSSRFPLSYYASMLYSS